MVFAVLLLIDGIAGQIHAQFVQRVAVHTGQNHRGVDIAALQLGQLGQRRGGVGVVGRRAGQRDQQFIGMQPGILAAQVGGFQRLDGGDGPG